MRHLCDCGNESLMEWRPGCAQVDWYLVGKDSPVSYDESAAASAATTPDAFTTVSGVGTGVLSRAIVIVKNRLENASYMCVAENRLGRIEHVVSITVKGVLVLYASIYTHRRVRVQLLLHTLYFTPCAAAAAAMSTSLINHYSFSLCLVYSLLFPLVLLHCNDFTFILEFVLSR